MHTATESPSGGGVYAVIALHRVVVVSNVISDDVQGLPTTNDNITCLGIDMTVFSMTWFRETVNSCMHHVVQIV